MAMSHNIENILSKPAASAHGYKEAQSPWPNKHFCCLVGRKKEVCLTVLMAAKNKKSDSDYLWWAPTNAKAYWSYEAHSTRVGKVACLFCRWFHTLSTPLNGSQQLSLLCCLEVCSLSAVFLFPLLCCKTVTPKNKMKFILTHFVVNTHQWSYFSEHLLLCTEKSFKFCVIWSAIIESSNQII